MTRRLRVSASLGFLLLLAASAQAQKDDVLTLLNGDRFTGEIKSYSQGRLAVDTSTAGWLSVKWNKILSISSNKLYDVETIDGVHHFGSLSPSDPPGRLTVVAGPDTITVGFFEIFDVSPVHQKFWRRWEGSLDLGFNYAQSSSLVQFNLSADATYRRRDHQIVSNISSFFSKQEGVTATERGAFSTYYDRFLGNRWIVEGLFGLDRNVQLGLKLRVGAGLALGRYVVQQNQKELMVFAGLFGNREQPVDGEGRLNGEAEIGGRYSYFMYDFPKVTISASLEVFPSLSEGGRVRLEASASAKREIVSDFYLSISVYDSFDSRDPSTGLAKNDWGPTLSVGWQF